MLTIGFYVLTVVILEFFTRKARFKLLHCILIFTSISGGIFMIMWQNAEEYEYTGSYHKVQGTQSFIVFMTILLQKCLGQAKVIL